MPALILAMGCGGLVLPGANAQDGGAAEQDIAEIEAALQQAVEEAIEAIEDEEPAQPRQRTNARLANYPELPIGHAGEGTNTGGRARPYRFTADGPGLLTVAVRAKTGEDMTIQVKNAQGRTLPDGQCDIDYNGDVGSEHLTVTITEPGDYEVAIEPLGNGGPFWIGGSWLAVEELGDLAPKKPDDATALRPGDTVEGEVEGDRMSEAWYAFTAPTDGLAVFDVNGRGGDLVLEVFTRGDFFEPSERIDGDRRANASNELYSGDLAKGDEVFIRVVSQSSSGTTYRARMRFLTADEEQEGAGR